MKINLKDKALFENRHNAPNAFQVDEMLKTVGVDTIDQLIEETIPAAIRLEKPLDLPAPKTETEFLQDFKKQAEKNILFKSYIGMGYYNTITPGVIQRNILENPGWYTAYTPYQAEIAQGRLEALANFQTMVMDLTGMEIANASLLDEGTAAAEAMAMLFSLRKKDKKKAFTYFVDDNTFPQTIDILKTRATPIGINLEFGDVTELDTAREDLFGVYAQYPDNHGEIKNLQPIIEQCQVNGVRVAVGSDLLALTLLKAPGEMGADVVVGSSQRFGIPMGYGGPHAAFFATREQFKRQVPGRIIGISIDSQGKSAYRMALQTREQHIKRDRATSNICTAQVLLAVMAGMYGVFHGPEGLKKIAAKTHGLAKMLEKGLNMLGYRQTNKNYFDTLKVTVQDKEVIRKIAEEKEINLRYFTDSVGISLDETTRYEDVMELLEIFEEASGDNINAEILYGFSDQVEVYFEDGLNRESDFMTHPVFHSYHAEHEILRYIKRLENKDLSLVHSMISLGSCTMKLNATSEMIPLSWPHFANIHPFAPFVQTQGYQEMFRELEIWLNEITGFAATSLQPNSGAQGEYAGLMVIRAYHLNNGDTERNITLVPTSAHGTNFASAVMAGTKVVLVNCDDAGNIDIEDLKAKAEKHSENLAALMVTYPSTHGVFEENIQEICATIHKHGGQVYMDGANMNAQVGLTSPANIGADVCHLNLHKTFCIPHGGGGPGMGPICVASHLAPFLPGNPLIHSGGSDAITSISAAGWGSASILTISYAYIAMMGGEGLTNATKIAILNTNYIKTRLEGHFDVLYIGKQGRSAHEMIIECRPFKKAGIEVEDIAKRLMDYGYHAPTVSFPVPGTMMIEPTESESKAELDRFCDAMVQIREEIREIENGRADAEDNVLKNAPHTVDTVTASEWKHSYTREKATYPLPFVYTRKFWPSVSRIDSAYGDRNLMCSCIPVEYYQEEEAATVED